MKKYKIKPTKKQLEYIKWYWKKFKEEQDVHLSRVQDIENGMSYATGIENLEFFMCDNEYVGVGDARRDMKLLQRSELE